MRQAVRERERMRDARANGDAETATYRCALLLNVAFTKLGNMQGGAYTFVMRETDVRPRLRGRIRGRSPHAGRLF